MIIQSFKQFNEQPKDETPVINFKASSKGALQETISQDLCRLTNLHGVSNGTLTEVRALKLCPMKHINVERWIDTGFPRLSLVCC